MGAFVRRTPLPVPRFCERFAAVKYGSRSLSARAGKQFYDWRAQASRVPKPVLFRLSLAPPVDRNRAVYVCQGVLETFRWLPATLAFGAPKHCERQIKN